MLKAHGVTHSTGRAVKHITHMCLKVTEVLERHKATLGKHGGRKNKTKHPGKVAALDFCKGTS